ncbi:GYD domain protein [Candidatus Bathyarchaeota archaeon]|nr:MAG: GYD domain protein [Candidatus Bathyarchaeota archaeon]
MHKYLIHGSYTEEGLKGLLNEGGSKKRREATEKGIKAIGGTLKAYYYASGDNYFYLIVDLPDNVNATAVTLATNSSGAVKNKTTVLITPEEIDRIVDQATKAVGAYRPPGQ